jgi:asparagine synthase (glutamine-hydrolysing)
MCGIAGVVGVDSSAKSLEAMGAAIHHRGPDDLGVYRQRGISLVFRRLAIVDLTGGRQPMANEDGQVQLVFNGEIYDHDRLRRQLVQRGHRFATGHSDTEVLVHGWEEWGYKLFERLNGMFAVAIWDARTRRLVLGRDRYGIKPLYYALLADGGLVFGSEIKAILASGLVESRPCAAGVLEYFAFQNLWQRQTMFAGIEQLEPGTTLTWHNGQVERRQYWDLTFPRRRKESSADLALEHRDILSRSIKRQLAADVPIKTYLSGGIDSTAITVVAHQLDPEMTAYSCIFDLDQVGADRQVDEREFSRLVAETYRIRRIELELSPTSLQECLTGYVRAQEDLRMGMGYPVYLIAQRVARDAKVVLSGTGGDEFHAGYVGRYKHMSQTAAAAPLPLRSLWQRLVRARPRLDRAGNAPYHLLYNCYVPQAQWPTAFTPEFLREAGDFDPVAVVDGFIARCPSDDWRDRLLYVDAKTYLAGLLAFEDKVSMAHSLETRVPLLDNELIDFLLDVPFDALWQGDVGKVLFRESVRPWVPESIYHKPKMGFGPPDASWYRGRLRPWIEDLLAPQLRGDRGVFQPNYVRDVLDEHFSGRVNNYHLIWTLLNFEMWCRVFGLYGAVPTSYARSA